MNINKDTTINELALTVRSYVALKRIGIRTVEELAHFDEEEAKKLYPHITEKAIIQINEKIEELGLKK